MDTPVTSSPAVVPASVPSAVAPPTTIVPAHEVGFGSKVKHFFSFIAWVFTGFGLIHAFRQRQAGAMRTDEIVVYTVHRSFYLWALILTGFVASFCVRHSFGSASVWG